MSKKAFPEKSDRSDPVATFRLIRYRKNMQVQKKNRLKRTSEARVMAVWNFLNSRLPSIFKNFFRMVVTSDSNVVSAQFFFWFLVFLRDLFEKLIPSHWISFLLFRHISMSKRRFSKNRLARTALRLIGCVDIEKIRRFKQKIDWNGHPRTELWPFEFTFFPGTFGL